MKKRIAMLILCCAIGMSGCTSDNDNKVAEIILKPVEQMVEPTLMAYNDSLIKKFKTTAIDFGEKINAQGGILISMDQYFLSYFTTYAQWGRVAKLDSELREKAASKLETSIDSIKNNHAEILSDYDALSSIKLKDYDEYEKIMSKIDIMYENYKQIYSVVMITGTDPVAMASELGEYGSAFILAQQELLAILGE